MMAWGYKLCGATLDHSCKRFMVASAFCIGSVLLFICFYFSVYKYTVEIAVANQRFTMSYQQ